MLELRPYQRRVIAACKDRRISYLALKMGAGKSLISLKLVESLSPILIICPAFVKDVWASEIEKWTSSSYGIVSNKIKMLPKTRFVIMSYESVCNTNINQLIHAFRFQAVIIDEAHYLKNNTAKRTKLIYGHRGIISLQSLKKIICLSGTPAESAMHLYPFIMAVNPNMPRAYFNPFAFGQRFCGAYKHPAFNYVVYPAKIENKDEFNALIEPYLLSVDPKEIQSDLPPISHNLITVDVSLAKVQKEWDMLKMTPENVAEDVPIPTLAAIAPLRIAILEEKTPIIKKFLENAVENGIKKIVVFYTHSAFTKLLYVDCLNINGKTPLKDRTRIIKKFNDSEKSIICCSIGATSVGVSLHTAEVVVFAESSWSWADNEQAYHRSYRRGLDNPLSVYWFAAKGSIDLHVLKKSLDKKKLLTTIEKDTIV